MYMIAMPYLETMIAACRDMCNCMCIYALVITGTCACNCGAHHLRVRACLPTLITILHANTGMTNCIAVCKSVHALLMLPRSTSIHFAALLSALHAMCLPDLLKLMFF